MPYSSWPADEADEDEEEADALLAAEDAVGGGGMKKELEAVLVLASWAATAAAKPE